MFRRREKRTFSGWMSFLFWPRGGWGRALRYIRHRVHRLPDSPEKIARGIFAGVFAAFTPFYGLHFIVAAMLAKLMRGNVFASLFATFVGNPATYLPIGFVAMKTGHLILGTQFDEHSHRSLGGKFLAAGEDLARNLHALFTDAEANWDNLARFFDEVFFPYLVGGILPGVVAGFVAYYLSVPIIRAYQNRRRGKLLAKVEEKRRKAAAKRREDALS